MWHCSFVTEKKLIGAWIRVRWKLKFIDLWANCCWSLVATIQHSCWSTNPFSVAFQIMANAIYFLDTPWAASLALGYQIALLLHPVNDVPKWWQIIVLKKFVKNWALMNLYTLKNYEIFRFNKNKKNMTLANLIHKVKSQQLFQKWSIKETWMLNVSATQLLKHHVQFFLTF